MPSSGTGPTKQLILYDLDGTLVDTGEDIARAVSHMLETLSGAPLPQEEIRRAVGQGLHELVQRCLKTDDPAHIARGMKLFEGYYAEHLADHSALYPGARAVLDYFKPKKQAVVTNKPDPFARDLLQALNVADYFVEIITGGSTQPKKPDPTAVRVLMQRQGVTAEQTLLVGDSLIDIQTGRNAGILTVVLTHGFADQAELAAAAPDVLVHSFEELLARARRAGW